MINEKEKYNPLLTLRFSCDKVPAEHYFAQVNREKGRILSMDSPLFSPKQFDYNVSANLFN